LKSATTFKPVDVKQHLIVDYDVINNSTDHHQLAKDALAAKQTLGVDQLEVWSDKASMF
jgi:hypothetical protein